MDVRRLVLGDWTPWMRDALDLVRLSLVVGAVAFTVAGDAGSAGVLATMAALTVLARLSIFPGSWTSPCCRPSPSRLGGGGRALRRGELVRQRLPLRAFRP